MTNTEPRFRVVLTDQVFPDVTIERELIEGAGGELVIARDRAEAIALLPQADAVLNTYMPIDADVIGSMSRAKIIARYGIGTDNVDLAAAKAAGVDVTNVPDYCIEEVATHTMALMLTLLRRIPQGQGVVQGGGWGVSTLGELHRLSALTVGLLGSGRIGNRVATAVEALGGRVLIHDPYLKTAPDGREVVDRDELFARSGIVSVHCPLTEETRGSVDAEALAAMPAGGYLVNTSRGPIVNLAAVVDALRNGHLAGAALDVLESEPPDLATIADVPNLVVTPHSAFLSVQALQESQRKATTQILNRLSDRPLDYPVV